MPNTCPNRPGHDRAGRTRGGLGQIIEVGSGVDAPFDILAAFDRIDHPPRGRDGGCDGEAGYVGLKSGQKLRGKGFQTVPPDDRLMVMTPGGAGIGDPRQRASLSVRDDVESGLVSSANAVAVYGLAG